MRRLTHLAYQAFLNWWGRLAILAGCVLAGGLAALVRTFLDPQVSPTEVTVAAGTGFALMAAGLVSFATLSGRFTEPLPADVDADVVDLGRVLELSPPVPRGTVYQSAAAEQPESSDGRRSPR